jgi:predicted short-subunit dehydrogenase-like oxidoreductase (DUF2520 family)
MKKQEFCIIGCGRLGISLAVFLSGQGYIAKGFSSKTIESVEKAIRFTGASMAYDKPWKAAQAAKIVFITTPDTLIEPVCKKIAAEGGFNTQSVVFHLSGALSSDILASAKKAGAVTGSIHPLQAFTPYEEGQKSPFTGINMSVEGDEKAVVLGKEIVNALSAHSFTIPTKAKTLYHASAVVASNYLVTVENFALKLLQQAGLSEDSAYEILEPLIMGSLNNIKKRGSINALTGPVARGDYEIVARHLNDIQQKLPQFSALYKLLGHYTLDIAKQRGELEEDTLQRLADLFIL